MQSVGPPAAQLDHGKEKTLPPRSALSAAVPLFVRPRRTWWASVQAVLSFTTGIYVLLIYVSGCSMSMASLLGTHYGIDGTRTVYAQYESPLAIALVEKIKLDPTAVVADLRRVIEGSPSTPVVYLVPTSTSGPAFEFTTAACTTEGTIGDILAPPAVLDIVWRVLSGLGGSNWPRDDAVVLIDCTFDAVLAQDSSTFRAHIVDQSVTYITTITAGALVLQRPHLRQTTVALQAIVVNATFASMEPADPALGAARTFGRALNPTTEVDHVVAIGAPFVADAPFERMVIDAVTERAQLEARIHHLDGSNESVTLLGTDGAFVHAESVFGSYYSYCFSVPSDAVANVAALQFLGVPNSKNAYAWGYCIVNAYLCAKVAFVLVSAAAIAVGSAPRGSSRLWGMLHNVPDLSHQLKTFMVVHAVLSIESCLLDRGWGIFEWCYAAAQLRAKASRMSQPLPAHIQCMLLSWVVVICHGAATVLRINVSLTVVILVTALFHANLAFFNGEMGLYVDVSYSVNVQANMDSLIPSSRGQLDMWMYYELSGVDVRYFLNEISAYLWATWLLLACQVVQFLCQWFVFPRQSRGRVMPQSVDATFILEERQGFVDTFGLGSSLEKRVAATDGTPFVSVEWAWYLGYVVVDHSYLFKLHDLPKLFINVLFNVDSFYVYGYHVSGNQVTVALSHFHVEDFPALRSLLRLSLRPLRQEWPMNETKRHLHLYDEADRRRKAAK